MQNSKILNEFMHRKANETSFHIMKFFEHTFLNSLKHQLNSLLIATLSQSHPLNMSLHSR